MTEMKPVQVVEQPTEAAPPGSAQGGLERLAWETEVFPQEQLAGLSPAPHGRQTKSRLRAQSDLNMLLMTDYTLYFYNKVNDNNNVTTNYKE